MGCYGLLWHGSGHHIPDIGTVIHRHCGFIHYILACMAVISDENPSDQTHYQSTFYELYMYITVHLLSCLYHCEAQSLQYRWCQGGWLTTFKVISVISHVQECDSFQRDFLERPLKSFFFSTKNVLAKFLVSLISLCHHPFRARWHCSYQNSMTMQAIL